MHVQRQIDNLLALRASEWLEILPTASERQLREFAAWLSESRLHVQEFLETAELECCLRGLDRMRQENVELLLERIVPAVVPLPARSSIAPQRPERRIHRWRSIGLAAICALVAIGIALLPGRPWGATIRYETAVGEQRVVELADTSVVTLNADSAIEVRLRDAARLIELRHGEAIFTVAHDPQRPFRVHTRAGFIQAVGTQFNVYDRVNGDTRVSVLDGRVDLKAQRRLEATTPSQFDELVLGAGEEADMHLDGTISRRKDAIVANTVAWRQRRLLFENAPLEEMVAEFNRYNKSLRVRLEGLHGDARRYDGTFDATDPEAFIALLSREPDLVIERRAGEVIIRPR